MAAKFLDVNNLSLTAKAICIVERAAVLLLCAIMQRKIIHVNVFVLSIG